MTLKVLKARFDDDAYLLWMDFNGNFHLTTNIYDAHVFESIDEATSFLKVRNQLIVDWRIIDYPKTTTE
jgi:hypothetical protein